MSTKERDAIAGLAFDAGTNCKRAADRIEKAILSDASNGQIPRLRHERTRLLAFYKKLGESAQAILGL